jgi:flagellar basal body-associated protein FliL
MERSNLMMIIIIFLLVALLGTIVGVLIYAFSVFQGFDEDGRPPWDREAIRRELEPEEINRIELSHTLTNVANEDGSITHVARIQVVIGYDNTAGRDSNDIGERLRNQTLFLQSTVLSQISNMTREVLAGPHGREVLRDALLETLRDAFNTHLIADILFLDWFVVPQ